MFKELYFAWYAIKKNIQSSAELRTSFLMNVIGMAINNSAFVLLWVFFVKSVGVIGGWTAADIVGLLGFGALSYGLVFSVAIGVRKLPDYVASGSFDRFMLSPKNILLRVATSAFSSSAVGDIVFGVASLAVYAVLIRMDLIQLLMMLALIIMTTITFLSIVIAVFSISFFFMDANSVSSGLFELFLTPSIFHGGAFQGVMRFIFIFLIPSLLIGALPVEAVRNISELKFLLIAALTVFWFILSIKIFYRAVKRYESSNFMTFGS